MYALWDSRRTQERERNKTNIWINNGVTLLYLKDRNLPTHKKTNSKQDKKQRDPQWEEYSQIVEQLRQRILKAVEEKQLLMYKGYLIRTTDFSLETMEARGSVITFKALKENLSVKNCISSKPILQEWSFVKLKYSLINKS